MSPSEPRKKVVALTGAGISAESGLATFRGAGGLWEGEPVMEVASPAGWQRNPRRVLQFYNERRRAARLAQPSAGHKWLAALEDFCEVTVVTQNVDDLHERAGSTHVVHLHGELLKARSVADEQTIYALDEADIHWGDCCPDGHQLRPHIVWFGELVPLMEQAAAHVLAAVVFLVVGTSLQVYPAAGLVELVPRQVPVYVVDPHTPPVAGRPQLHVFQEAAGTGLEKIYHALRAAVGH